MNVARTIVPVAAASLSLDQVRELLQAEACWAPDLSAPVNSVGAADLMSDVLAFGRPGMLLLTGLITTQAVRTAAITDLTALVFVRGKLPPEDVLMMAKQAGMPVLSTPLTMFEASGRLYEALFGARTDR
jgi:predicted transcriptional regulator